MRIFGALILSIISVNMYSQSIPKDVIDDWENQIANGGTWVSTDNTGNYDAWGMQFSWGLGKKSMNAKLYAIKDKKDIGTIWTFKIYYHPEKKQVIIDQWGSDGSFAHGDIEVLGKGNASSVSTFYNTDGSTFKLKHIQKLEGDIRHSDTFVINEKGEWQKSQTYVWKRNGL